VIPIGDDRPVHGAPVGNWTLMGLCVVIFFWQLSLGDAGGFLVHERGFIAAWTFLPEFVPWDFALPSRLTTMVTYIFLHGGWFHLLGNLLFMWIFSNSVENVMGHPGFILFFVVCGISAAYGQYLAMPDSVVPMIGASGAVSGVLGAYLVMFPRAEIKVMVPIFIIVRIVSLPAWIVLMAWFAIQLLYTVAPETAPAEIAFEAHLSGFITGLLLAFAGSRVFRLI
jgi:membrane associated rhomboid family serine protease